MREVEERRLHPFACATASMAELHNLYKHDEWIVILVYKQLFTYIILNKSSFTSVIGVGFNSSASQVPSIACMT